MLLRSVVVLSVFEKICLSLREELASLCLPAAQEDWSAYFLTSCLFILPVYVCHMAYMWRSEDSLLQLVLLACPCLDCLVLS